MGARFPVVSEPTAEAGTAQGDNGVGAADSPKHPGSFEADGNHRFAPSFDDAGADEETLSAEIRVTHAVGVALEVVGFGSDELGEFFGVGTKLAQEVHQGLDLAPFEKLEGAGHPAFAPLLVLEKQGGRKFPEVLAGVIKIHNLDRSRELLSGHIPDPHGAIGKYDYLLGSAPAPPPGFGVHAETKLFGGLNGAHIGSGILVAHGPPFRIGGGLSEAATQLDFARVRG